jgi:hypothetical protein
MLVVSYQLRHVLDLNSLHTANVKEASGCARGEVRRRLIAHNVEGIGQSANNVFVISNNGERADGRFQRLVRAVPKE